MYFHDRLDRIPITITASELNCLREVILNDIKNKGLDSEFENASESCKRHWQRMINHRSGMLNRIEDALYRHSLTD